MILLTLTPMLGFITLSMTQCASPPIVEYNPTFCGIFLRSTAPSSRLSTPTVRHPHNPRNSTPTTSEPNYDPIMASWYVSFLWSSSAVC